MPPAMVSSGTAAAAAAAAVVSPRTAPKQNPPLWNPRSGETLAGIAPFTIPFASEGFWVAADAMDPQSVERGAPPRGNPREPNLEGVFSMLFQSPNVDKAPVASSSGLSRPRMVKVRRHFPLSRVRPGLVVPADFEGVGEQGLNPFLRDPYPAAGFSDQVSFGISCSSSDAVRTEGANFVFGNNSSCFQRDGAVAPASDGLFSSSIDRNAGGFQPGTTEGANFVSAARHTTGTTDSSYLKDCTYRDVGGASSKFETVRGTAGQFTSSNEECIRSTANVFMFGSSSEESATSHRSATRGFDKSAVGKLPEELQTLNIKCSGTADNIRKSEAGDHNLGSRDGGAFVFSSSKNVSGSFGEHNCTQGAFVFGSSSRKNSIPDLSSSGGSDRSSVEKLPDYLRELKIKDSTLKNIPGDTGSANLKFSTTGSHVSEGKMIPDDSTFNSEAIKSHFYVKENVESVLPDEMRKLNIEVPNSVSSLSETQGPCNSSQVDEKKTFMFGCNMGIGSHETSVDKPPEGMETVNSWNITIGQPEDSKDEGIPKSTSGFALRNFYEKSEDPGQRAADGFDESAGGKLPEEIQKLNIRDPENDDTIGKASFGDSILEANSGGFVYASSKSVSDSFSEKDRTEGVFVFGSKPKGFDPDLSASGVSAKSFGSYNTGTFAPESNGNVSGSYGGTSFEECFTSESRTMPGTSCSAGAVDSDNNSWKTKASGHVSGKSSFTSGTGKCFSASSGENNSSSGVFVFGSSSNRNKAYDQSRSFWFDRSDRLPDEIQRLNIGCSGADDHYGKAEGRDFEPLVDESGVFVSNSSKNKYAAFGSDRFTGSTTSLGSSSHPCNQDANSVAGASYPIPVMESCKPKTETTASSFSVSLGPIFQSSGYNSTFTDYCGLGTPHVNESTNQDPSVDSSVVASFQNSAFSAKKGLRSHTRVRKRRGKLKDSATLFQRGGTGAFSREKSSQEKPDLDSQEGYSPMDFSPCHLESSVGDEYSREASVASEESTPSDSCHFSTNIKNSFSAYGSAEDLANATMKSSSSEFVKEADGGSGFPLASGSSGFTDSSFTFAASSSTQGSISASKHSHRRKYRTKVGRDAYASISDPNTQLLPNLSSSSHLDDTGAQTEVPSAFQRKGSETNKTSHVKQEGISMAASATTGQEACEKWRLMGNQAYANGDLCKAEEYYTQGVKSVSPNEASRDCSKTLMLCYSNRAAARMSIGRIREALFDCMMATDIDPGFLRAQLRAASCHLLLGETEEACNRFKKCLPGGCASSLDQKFVFEASDGLQKVKLVADCMERAASLLQKGTTDDATLVLKIISDALSLSPYSESLIEIKAEALLMLRHYGELIQLLDQTLDTAEKNSTILSTSDQFKDWDYSRSIPTRAKAWRSYLKSRAYFCLGRLEEALALLKGNEQVEAVTDRSKSDSWALLSVTVSELLRLKVAGNTAFKSGQHSEAVEHYTAALTYNIESRPFAAVCFCNRAAAYQALGQITEAISDCSLAIALDPNYPKAISRRATLHEMIRDYGQAAGDLHRLISFLERKQEDRLGGGRPTVDDPELVRLRLAKVEEKARKEIPLDMYMILGIESSSDAAEIKKAYRKAALRHHPDKASQLLVRSENTDEKLWKEVADEVHRDTDRLFKMIGEAYAVLSDPSKRLQYDTEEEIRTSLKGSGASTTHQQQYHTPGHYERSSSRWHSGDHPFKSYESSSQRSTGYYRTRRYY